MKKSKKKLRKLLAQYKEELIKKPYIKNNSRIVDCIDFLIEEINNAIYP